MQQTFSELVLVSSSDEISNLIDSYFKALIRMHKFSCIEKLIRNKKCLPKVKLGKIASLNLQACLSKKILEESHTLNQKCN